MVNSFNSNNYLLSDSLQSNKQIKNKNKIRINYFFTFKPQNISPININLHCSSHQNRQLTNNKIPKEPINFL